MYPIQSITGFQPVIFLSDIFRQLSGNFARQAVPFMFFSSKFVAFK